MKEIISFRGEARVNDFNASWPFSTLNANHKQIIIRVLFKTYILKKEDIKALIIHKGLISSGIKIEHNQSNLPKKLIFWSSRILNVKEELEEIGYIFNSH